MQDTPIAREFWNRNRIPSAFAARVSTLLLPVLLISCQEGLAHLQNTHQTLMEYATAQAALLPTPLDIPYVSMQASQMRDGASNEDNLIGDEISPYLIRPRNHAYNPLTDEGFSIPGVWQGATARDTAADRWNRMTSAFLNGSFDGGDFVGAWHYLGRASHLLQDVTSPLHALAQRHDGITYPFVCQFESYWGTNDSSLRSILSSIGGPLHSSVLDAKATEGLDAFSTQRLQDRFSNSSPNKNNDDVRGWVEVMAWISYFRATFWGQVTMGSSTGNGVATSSSTAATTFSDGVVSSQPNVLHTMFNGNARWINNFIGDDYYEITDHSGSVFRFMSFLDVDDWAACGQAPSHEGWAYGQKDSSIRLNGSDDDDDGVRVTGRFWFDLRELGRGASGAMNRYCYPNFHPDGNPMTEHLHEYFGNNLDPLAVRYNAGLLGLANRRVTVNTADSTPANGFSWGRQDNFGNAASFDARAGGSAFFFVAKSQVSLTAPATDSAGRAFVRWLKEGSIFSGNSSRTIALNTSSSPIPQNGVIYTAEYGVPPPNISVTVQSNPSGLSFTLDDTPYTAPQIFSWPTGSGHTIATTSAQSDGAGVQYVWSDWSDGGGMSHLIAPTNDTTYTANFTAQPFLAVQASYNGLFYETNGVFQQSCGFFTINTTAKGTFTGTIRVGGTRYSISAKFDGLGKATRTITRRNQTPLTVELRVDLAPGEDRITGTVSDGTWTSQLAADRAVFSKLNPFPQPGPYTLIIPGDYNSATEPGGDSFGTLSVDAAGKVRLAASLADGTKISQAVPVSKNRQWPFYAALYGSKGSILSWITFSNAPTTDLSGDVSWIKPAAAAAKYYPAGFTFETTASGSRYHRPAAGSKVLDLTDGQLALNGANLAQNITNLVSLGANNKVTSSTSSKLKLAFTLSTGRFSGSVVNPATSKIPFTGVVLQKQNVGSGFFLNANQSGRVLLEPLP